MNARPPRSARGHSHASNPPQPASGAGARRLGAALGRAVRALAQRAAPPRPPVPSTPADMAEPRSAWERAAEARLSRIEQKLTNQNRLLMLAVLSIAADVIVKVSAR